jgi:O-antigen biosynthesis protein WbqP
METLKEKDDMKSDHAKVYPDGIGDPMAEYSDDFYEELIEGFEANTKKRLGYRFLKRFFDIALSAFLLVLLLPVMLVLIIAIKCDSKGPAIFKQDRMGRNGKTFRCYKFRSMRIDAPKDCATSLLEHPEAYQTKVGKVLRRLSLDELPQLWCVLIGTMSFIGYRPLVLTEEKCNEMRKRLGVFEMRPGISGYSQVRGRDDVYYKNKAIMDAYYVKNASVAFDLKLLIQTIAVVLKRDGNSDVKHKKD